MRQSKREEILRAATAVVQREGVTALTYEAVAAEAGLTKGGLLYHFPTRDDLLHGLHVYVAGQWEQAMVAEGGAPAEQLDDDARFAAFVRASHYPDRAELLLMLEASETPTTNAVWDEVYQRWAPEPPSAEADDAELERFVARLAADGLWLFQSLAAAERMDLRFDPQLRRRIADRIGRMGRSAGEQP